MGRFNTGEGIIGATYGYLTVLSRGDNYVSPKGHIKVRWVCKCVCGKEKIILNSKLNTLGISCGCLVEEIRRVRNYTYNSWKSMVARCNNPKVPQYKDYGGRGITVCSSWNPLLGGSFEKFYSDMGRRPESTSIERIDNNAGYSADNCKWATVQEQAKNKRKSSLNSSGRTGVYKVGNTDSWRAMIKCEGVKIELGSFKDFYLAVKAREAAELKYFGFIKE